jgi:uncharacterized small protein (DUF1192 family)
MEHVVMDEDELLRKSSTTIVPGEDVSNLSISELEMRIQILKEEIERLEGEVKSKNESRNMADSVFKL